MKYLLLSFILSLGVQAGDRKTGNGGDAVVCGETTELLDYYEGKVSVSNSNFGSGTTEIDIANYLLQKLDRDVLRYVVHKERLDSFMSEVAFVQEALPDIKDYGHIFFPSNCTVVQAAIQVNPATDPSGKRYIIHEPTWNAMNVQNKAGLILHELIYREALERRAENSKKVRLANAYLAKADQWEYSLEGLVQSLEDESSVAVEENFYKHQSSTPGMHYVPTVKRFYSLLIGYERLEHYTASIVSEILGSSHPFGLMEIMRRKDKNMHWDNPWMDYIEDFISPQPDSYYSYQFNSNLLKTQIQQETDIINKSIIASRLPAEEFTYKLNLLEEIGQSSESDLKKSIAGAQVLGHLFRDNMQSTFSEIGAKDFIYEYVEKEELAKLVEVLITDFDMLMVQDKAFPFNEVGSYGRASRGRASVLRWILSGAPDSFRAPLKNKIIEMINYSDSLSNVKFTNLIDLLQSYNNLKFVKQPIMLSEENYQKLLLRSEDYLSENKHHFWNVIGGIVESIADPKPYILQCLTTRNAEFVTYSRGRNDLVNNCERMIVKSASTSAHEVDLGSDELRKLVDINIGSVINFYTSSSELLRNAFRSLLDYNLQLYPAELKRLAYHEMSEIVNTSSRWNDRRVELIGLLTELDDNIVSGIQFSFDTAENEMQEKIIRNIFGNLSSLSQASINFLNAVSSGSYSQEVKAAAAEVLQN